MLRIRPATTSLVACSLLALNGCLDPTDPEPGPPATLTIQGGNEQEAAAGSALPDPLAVEVLDASGDPVPGVSVTWSVTAGGGSVSPTSSTTNGQGRATTEWTLGAAADENTATAAVGDLEVTFTADGVPGEPAELVEAGGDMQAALVGNTLEDSVRVQVVDANGNPVPGVTVAWTVSGGDGSVEPESSVADETGFAATAWTLGTAAGENTLIASVDGVSRTFTATAASPVVSLKSGFAQTCILNGLQEMWCWGFVFYGGLGDTAGTHTSTTPVLVAGDHAWAETGVGGNSICGIDDEGEAYCWGGDNQQQIGDADWADKTTPTPVEGGQVWAEIAPGGAHVCGVTVDAAAFCWGWNRDGQLGNGDTSGTNQPLPAPVSGGIEWASVAPGVFHTCGLSEDGDAYCWGNGSGGALGTGSAAGGAEPSPVAGDQTWASLSSGRNFSCTVTMLGAGWCWGEGDDGQLGNGQAADRDTPTEVAGGHQWERIYAGPGRHSCGITRASEAYCWGSREDGRLGNGASGYGVEPAPVLVSGGHTWRQLGLGDSSTCGVTEDDRVFCWGSGYLGRTGPAGTVAVPTEIDLP